MSGSSNRFCDTTIGWLISGILHMVLLLGIVTAEAKKPHPDDELLKSKAVIMEVLPPSPPEPPAPEPEPEPAPEPEPPPPEPPAPPPPAPEPPKPKPLPEPPKPKPLPEPPKPKPLPEPPKPKPLPEPPKPKPLPEPPKPKRPSIAERLRQAEIKQAPRRQPQTQRPVSRTQATSVEELRRRMGRAGRVEPSPSSPRSSSTRRVPRMTVEQESANYADLVVRQAYYDAWETPRVGDRRPSPVVVELDVTSDGRVVNAWISRRSNDVRMNQSVESLIRSIRRFRPFSELGITSSSLHLIVTMELVE